MIGHVTQGTNDMEPAKNLYTTPLAPPGASVLVNMGCLVAIGNTPGASMPSICTPRDGAPSTVGNGAMVAILHGG